MWTTYSNLHVSNPSKRNLITLQVEGGRTIYLSGVHKSAKYVPQNEQPLEIIFFLTDSVDGIRKL